MSDTSAYIAGELGHPIPSMKRMASILRDAGLHVYIGRYSIRVEDCSHFNFEEYGGDLGDPVIDADADSVDELVRDANLVSSALSRAGIRHRFEIYQHGCHDMMAYIHHHWPLNDKDFDT